MPTATKIEIISLDDNDGVSGGGVEHTTTAISDSIINTHVSDKEQYGVVTIYNEEDYYYYYNNMIKPIQETTINSALYLMDAVDHSVLTMKKKKMIYTMLIFAMLIIAIIIMYRLRVFR